MLACKFPKQSALGVPREPGPMMELTAIVTGTNVLAEKFLLAPELKLMQLT